MGKYTEAHEDYKRTEQILLALLIYVQKAQSVRKICIGHT